MSHISVTQHYIAYHTCSLLYLSRDQIFHLTPVPYVGFLLWSVIYCYWTVMGVEVWLSHSFSPFLPEEAWAALRVQLLPLYDGWWKWTGVKGFHAWFPHIPPFKARLICSLVCKTGMISGEAFHHWMSKHFTHMRLNQTFKNKSHFNKCA